MMLLQELESTKRLLEGQYAFEEGFPRIHLSITSVSGSICKFPGC